MQAFSQTVFDRFQVRKTRAQKAAFRAALRDSLEGMGYQVTEETSPIARSTNVIVGDLDSAQVICTAHYDTCARLPIPNFIAPKNLLVTLGYQLLLCVLIFAVVFVVSAGITFAGLSLGVPELVVHLLVMATVVALFVLFFAGPANPRTANDNTSGVVVLTEALGTLPEADRRNVAFVFFDNEELGLLGSSYFKKLHGKQVQGTPLINFDCVSDGDHVLLVQGRAALKSARVREMMDGALALPEGKSREFASAGKAMYPSDQMLFPMGVGVVALRHRPVIGYYISRIHTPRDTCFDRANIEMLRAFVVRMAQGKDA